MPVQFTTAARRLGLAAATTTAALIVAYAVTLVVGLVSLPSPDQQIADPLFTVLEVLIIALMPAVVVLMVVVHAWAPAHLKTLSLTSLVAMALVAVVTCSLHFVVLTLSRQDAFASQPWLPLVLSFRWPSVVYALDILAWDVFFAIAVLFAAPLFGGDRLGRWLRGTLVASGLLSLAGLSGVVAGDMQLRNIGIAGYVGVFLAAVILLGVLFRRTPARAA